MKKKIAWLVASFLVALSLVTASCAPTVVEEEKKEVVEGVGKEAEKEVEKEVVKKEELLPPEVPKYGGVINVAYPEDVMGFDPDRDMKLRSWSTRLANDRLLTGDWAKGPAGTGEVDWTIGEAGRLELLTGELAESYEISEPGTFIFHIRKGVRWNDKPPMNGREFTADDAAFNINREYSPGSYVYSSHAPVGEVPESITVLDRYTVEVKVPLEWQGVMLSEIGNWLEMLAPEVIEMYGDARDWRNAQTTGPFMLTGYVSAVSHTYVRNPNYFMKDPIHPENHLPYVDGINLLIITDASTKMAAFRTGKIDMQSEVSYTDSDTLLKRNPQLQRGATIRHPDLLGGRIDKPELPFKDIRVRRALNMAVNKQEIVEEYYDGNAWLLAEPVGPLPVMSASYTPLEELPEAARELFTYNPDKAKQLLAEAGYPNGFKTEVACDIKMADYMSLIKSYFADVGVDMEIKTMEAGVFETLGRGRKHEEMLLRYQHRANPYDLTNFRIENSSDFAYYQNPRVDEAHQVIAGAMGSDPDTFNRTLKEINVFLLEEAPYVWLPGEKVYNMWWPWLQNFYGCAYIGKSGEDQWFRYVWLDQALKKSMGY